jgi:hypothetical protein
MGSITARPRAVVVAAMRVRGVVVNGMAQRSRSR